MTEPTYQKTGRGGAGNFWSPDDLTSTAGDADVEAQKPAVGEELERSVTAQKEQAEYAHTGRGGAGNWVKPSELPVPEIPDRSSSVANGTGPSTAGTIKAVFKGGRGGAGNIDWSGAAEREREERERESEREED
ncbi:hypothetical protein LSUE1_G009487, partial [Lachnellula suecica]